MSSSTEDIDGGDDDSYYLDTTALQGLYLPETATNVEDYNIDATALNINATALRETGELSGLGSELSALTVSFTPSEVNGIGGIVDDDKNDDQLSPLRERNLDQQLVAQPANNNVSTTKLSAKEKWNIIRPIIIAAVTKVLVQSKTDSSIKARGGKKSLWDEDQNKWGQIDWENQMTPSIVDNVVEQYNDDDSVSTADQLSTKEVAKAYLSIGSKRDMILVDAKIAAGYTSGSRYKATSAAVATRNEDEQKGPSNLFAEEHADKYKDVFLTMEDNTLRRMKGLTALPTPEALVGKHFKGRGSIEQSIIEATKDFLANERLTKEYCGTSFGGDVHTPESCAALFNEPVDEFTNAFAVFCIDKGLDPSNGVLALRQFTGLAAGNEFLATVQAHFLGIESNLDTKVESGEVYTVSWAVAVKDSIIENDDCRGATMKRTGTCHCQMRNPFKLKVSVAYSAVTCHFLSMNAVKSLASGLDEEDRNSGMYHAVPLTEGRRIAQMKVGIMVNQGLPTFKVTIPATRDIGGGIPVVKDRVIKDTPYSCELCGDTKLNDFANGMKCSTLHRCIRIFRNHQYGIVFGGHLYNPKLRTWLESKEYESLDDYLGYKDEDEGRLKEIKGYKRKSNSRNSLERGGKGLGNQEEATDCDADHWLSRLALYGSNGKYGTGSMGHTTNCTHTEVRRDSKDRCYGFSIAPYKADPESWTDKIYKRTYK